ncbi:hypothetical protein [Parachitinimonas caeni]|uniref:CHAT domain-containing protein n=1 Tax=Parachitinimonas caeni TaxID=3031301 RepID=A0ABT7E365_9NEIS|nr:hypothetical protein [Parachitinimonas caeni]MDK2126751.1 hypothetical protein [Parachitinimonas caeni]
MSKKKSQNFGVRVFDTVLDTKRRRDTTTRNSADFWEVFCKAAGWSFGYERIHSLVDLTHFLGRGIHESFIIFSGHGNEEGFFLTNGDKVDSDSIADMMSPRNENKSIIFSSCLMGKDDEHCEALRVALKAKHLFSYRHSMQDRFCFLFESILLTLIEQNQNFGRKEFEEFQAKTSFMTRINKAYVRSHPMKMYEEWF